MPLYLHLYSLSAVIIISRQNGGNNVCRGVYGTEVHTTRTLPKAYKFVEKKSEQMHIHLKMYEEYMCFLGNSKGIF